MILPRNCLAWVMLDVALLPAARPASADVISHSVQDERLQRLTVFADCEFRLGHITADQAQTITSAAWPGWKHYYYLFEGNMPCRPSTP